MGYPFSNLTVTYLMAAYSTSILYTMITRLVLEQHRVRMVGYYITLFHIYRDGQILFIYGARCRNPAYRLA